MKSKKLSPLVFAALGIVFGDIGTSPLYTLKTILSLAGGQPTSEAALGLLSLIIWTLVIVVSIKYVTYVMRVDNGGEGGILALMSLLGMKNCHRPILIAFGLFGAALIYGDGAITPAISVLSAVEGLEMATPHLQSFIVFFAIIILIALFLLQSIGTARIGWIFGPIMALWFVVIGVLGVRGILHHPNIYLAFNPAYAVHYLMDNGFQAFLVLGGIFLCVTGAEALYADMGHVGAPSIRIAWYGLVFPALVLNYAGQTALLLAGAPADSNLFYLLCPKPYLLPLIGLATVATIIASQAIISGAFSMTRQAIQLGWFPPVRVTQTSSQGHGQIYVGAVNWILMIMTLALTIGFGSSDNLAAAYGIAVSLTMLLTTTLLYIAMREIWKWNMLLSIVVCGIFLCLDISFFAANLFKVAQGGWVPLLLAAFIYCLMTTWHRGAQATSYYLASLAEPLDEFLDKIHKSSIPRVPGTAIFLTRMSDQTPPTLIWHVKNNRVLHEKLVALTVRTELVPWIKPAKRMTVTQIAPDFSRIVAHYGFMENPNLPKLLQQAHKAGCDIDIDDIIYYVGHETVMHRESKKCMPLWQERLYAFMQRNTAHVSEYFALPRDQVVEIGRRIEI